MIGRVQKKIELTPICLPFVDGYRDSGWGWQADVSHPWLALSAALWLRFHGECGWSKGMAVRGALARAGVRGENPILSAVEPGGRRGRSGGFGTVWLRRGESGMKKPDELFSVEGKKVALTGGAGVLGRGMALALAERGAWVCLIDYDVFRANEICKEIEERGGIAIPVQANVLDREQLQDAFGCAVQTLGGLDVLINGAGGNKKEATTCPDLSFFDLPEDALKWVHGSEPDGDGAAVPGVRGGVCEFEEGGDRQHRVDERVSALDEDSGLFGGEGGGGELHAVAGRAHGDELFA